MSQYNDEIMRFLKRSVSADSGTFSESDTTSTSSPATFAIQTQDAPVSLASSVAAPPTSTVSLFEGSTISGGTPAPYIDLGDDTGGSLVNLTVSPTIDVAASVVLSVLQTTVKDIGTIILKPNTTYVFEVTSASVTPEPVLFGGVVRRVV
jgi:hypothetical protein